MRRIAYLLGAVVLLAAGVAVAAYATPGNDPPGRDPCSHGATGKPCRPDPQPDRGKDCDHHGKQGGVNEDHCKPPTTTVPTTTVPTTTVPTTTVPTTTTPTTTTPTTTTPTTTTPTTTTTPSPTTTTPPAVTPPVTPPATTSTTTAPPTTTTEASPPVTARPKPGAPKKRTTVQTKPPKLTGNPKTDKCKDLHNGTMKCKGVIVTPAQG